MSETGNREFSTRMMSHVVCQMSNAYVNPWDMVNNFYFHVMLKSHCLSIYKLEGVLSVASFETFGSGSFGGEPFWQFWW